jgi:acyl-CoA dehydrogenase
MIARHSMWRHAESDVLQHKARAFFGRSRSPACAHAPDRADSEAANWRWAGRLGLLCRSIPEEYGGHGGTLGDDIIVAQEALRAVPHGGSLMAASLHAPQLLLACADPEQRSHWLPPLTRGDRVLSYLVIESADAAGFRTLEATAARCGDGFVLNGTKALLRVDAPLDLALVAARLRGHAPQALSVFVLDLRTAENVRVTPNDATPDPLRVQRATVVLDDVHVPSHALLGTADGAYGLLVEHFIRYHLAAATVRCALLDLAIDIAIGQLCAPCRLDLPSAARQSCTRHGLGEILMAIDAAHTLIDTLVYRTINGERIGWPDVVTATRVAGVAQARLEAWRPPGPIDAPPFREHSDFRRLAAQFSAGYGVCDVAMRDLYVSAAVPRMIRSEGPVSA